MNESIIIDITDSVIKNLIMVFGEEKTRKILNESLVRNKETSMMYASYEVEKQS